MVTMSVQEIIERERKRNRGGKAPAAARAPKAPKEKKPKEMQHWGCTGFVRTGCGGRGARVVDLKRGKAELLEKHDAMQKDFDAEIKAAAAKEVEDEKRIAKAAEEAAQAAAKAEQDKIDAAHAALQPGKAGKARAPKAAKKAAKITGRAKAKK